MLSQKHKDMSYMMVIKANRKGMPKNLHSRMPILKNILKAMNIAIIEKEGYEADDVLGT